MTKTIRKVPSKGNRKRNERNRRGVGRVSQDLGKKSVREKKCGREDKGGGNKKKVETMKKVFE